MMLPQYPARWNRALLGRDAVCWHAGATPMLDMGAAGGLMTGLAQQSFLYYATKWGRGARWVNTTSGGVSFVGVQPLKPTTGVSFLVIAQPPNSTDFSTYFSQRLLASTTPSIQLSCNIFPSGSAEAGTILLRMVNSAAANCSMRALNQTDGELHVWTGYHNDASTGKMWRDGIAQTVTNTNPISGTFTDSTQEVRIGNAAAVTTTGSVVDHPFLAVIMWPRQVDDTLLQMLGRNPTLAFMQAKRSARNSAIPTLSAATVTNITGTTATPRVTITFP